MVFIYRELRNLEVSKEVTKLVGRDALLTCFLAAFAFSLATIALWIDALTPNPMPSNILLVLIAITSGLLGIIALFWSAVDRTRSK